MMEEFGGFGGDSQGIYNQEGILVRRGLYHQQQQELSS